MPSVKLYKSDGSEDAPVALNDAVFDVEPNRTLVHQVAVALMANKRHGTHDTKVRHEVRGGGKKPFRQKGTGNARQGSSREPQMRGGGTVFGPHPRSYRKRVPQKMSRKALCCMLTDRVRNDALCVIDGFQLEAPKTARLSSVFSRVAPEQRKTLYVTAGNEPNVVRSAGNAAGITVRTAADVNALDVLDARRVVIAKDALAVLEKRLS
jgi:large subunit ribosomal protein L4